MINFVQPGGILEITAPVGGVTSGSPVQIGAGLLGIGALDALATVSVNMQVEGVFDVAKVSAQAWAEGDPVYWDATAEVMTTVKGGLFAGYAVAVAANPSSTGRMRLSPGSDLGFHVGLSAVPLVDDTVDRQFVSGYFDSGATSGDSRGLSITLNATGVLQTYSTGIYGECAPSVQVRNPVGVQGQLSFGVGGWIQGLGYAIGGYASLPNAIVAATGNFACILGEVAAGGSATNVAACSRAAIIDLRVSGNGTGIATFETKGSVISLVGFTQASGVTKMISSTRLAELPSGTIGMRVGVGAAGGGDSMYYVPLVPAAEWN